MNCLLAVLHSDCSISLMAGGGGGLAPSWALLTPVGGREGEWNAHWVRIALLCSVWMLDMGVGLADWVEGWWW